MKITEKQIAQFPMQNVYDSEAQKLVCIYFTVDDFELYLVLERENPAANVSKLLYVSHKTENAPCPVCNLRNATVCKALQEHMPALMNRLTEFPKIRLKWLYKTFIA